MKGINLEFQSQGIVGMLEHQDNTPYYQSLGVDELLRVYPDSVTHRMSTAMFMLGYIEGKRAERARRRRT